MRHNLNAKRWNSNKSHGYSVATFGVLLAFSVRYILHPLLGASLPLFFFQLNTILVAYFFGLFPALLTLALSAPLMIFYFLEPFGALSVVDQRDVTLMLAYLSYTLLTGFLVELLRREKYNANMAFLVSETRLKLMVEGDQKMRSIMRKTLSKR
ncbi:DUF4118 domain-containing protein [Polynucleobacter sp. MG-28-Ekke-A2]|uniref:DUF4118 domain-containing protein n=1 Tax=Polynucleobacter sp. MG-28-Ekke-A2 TaxID=3108276 RepID=UPI002B227276|nr:DUF4118 domain-containing protein [Polynucleobacter sp. MG-28-Ekke-A2]MEA9601223.1 DUF4118 domain-containing protein [Polynucleobacter sp. MG-28-Ekke-A2]